MVGVEPAAVRSAPVNTCFDGGSLSFVELSSVEAVLTGGQDQKYSSNSGEAYVHNKKILPGCWAGFSVCQQTTIQLDNLIFGQIRIICIF